MADPMTLASPTEGAGQRRSLAAILTSAFMVGVVIGMTTPLVSFRLNALGHDATAVGLLAALYAATAFVVGPFLDAVTRRLGLVRVIVCGLLLSALPLAAMADADSIVVIGGLRILMGVGTATTWIASEVWLNRVATVHNRGRIIGWYATIWMAGLAAGPALLSLIGTTGALPFLVGAGVLLGGVVPVLWALRYAPKPYGRARPGAIAAAVLAAPLAMAAGLASGASEGTFFTLFPLYGLAIGFDERTTVLLSTVFAAGAIVFQPPTGWLADRVDRRRLIVAIAVTCLACVALMPMALVAPWSLWPVMFVCGGMVAGFYTVGLILIGHRFAGTGIATANAVFIMSYTAGMIAGPTAVGIGMDLWHPHGMLVVLAALYLSFTALGGVRFPFGGNGPR